MRHSDHIQGDPKFAGQPNTTMVPLGTGPMAQFWGWTQATWPEQTMTYDLGGRVLDVIATPGHQAAGITFYDRRTQLLLTGDIVYPGHLFVFSPQSWPVFRASIRRLVLWAQQNPVQWVLGCHIEMTSQPGGCHALGHTRPIPMSTSWSWHLGCSRKCWTLRARWATTRSVGSSRTIS